MFDEARRIAETRLHAELTFLVDYEPKGPTDRIVERRERLLSGYFRAAVLSNFNGQVRLRKADRFTVDPELLHEKYKTFLEVERHGVNDAAAEAHIADLQ